MADTKTELLTLTTGDYILDANDLWSHMEKRQAGAGIEVTPEMIEAGANVLWGYLPDREYPEIKLREIISAMNAVSPDRRRILLPG